MKKETQNILRGPWREKLRRFWHDRQWYIVGVLWIVVIILGYIGIDRTFTASGESMPTLDIFYRILLLFKLNYSFTGAVAWQLEVARFMAPLVAIFTVVQAFIAVFYRQIQVSRIRFASDHVVICGLGRKGMLLARDFYDHGFRVVVIEQDEADPLIEECRALGAVVLTGDATDPEMLRKARVGRARYLVSVFGDDGSNAEVAVSARAVTRGQHGRPLTCLVHIVDLHLCNLLREEEMRLTQDGNLRLEFFNVFDLGALALLQEHPPFELAETNACRTPHLLLVGMGCMGESIVSHATHDLWLDATERKEKQAKDGDSPELRKDQANDIDPIGPRKMPRISVIDLVAENRIGSLAQKYPRMRDVCKLDPLPMDVESEEFARGDFLFDTGGQCSVSMIYICLDNDSRSLTSALTLLQRTRTCRVPIVVRMVSDSGLATLLSGEASEGQGFSDLHAFGLLERTCTLDLLLGGINEVLARAIHEEYMMSKTWLLSKDVRLSKEELEIAIENDPALRPWDDLDESYKESNRSQADGFSADLKAIDCGIAPLCDWDTPLFEFTKEEIEVMAGLEHMRWMEERLAEGWTYASGKKNREKMTHPYLVLWGELTENIKDLDRNTVCEIPSFLARVGFQVYKIPMD
jgi:hypothetical protein